MPWAKLSECFACRSNQVQSKLATELWGALGEYMASSKKLDQFDKVCLIVAGAEVPYGHNTFEKMLVRKSLWPIPPLNVGEISEVLGQISQELNDPAFATTLINWSGGSPWYVRLILSCVQYLSGANSAKNTALRGQTLIDAACKAAENILRVRPEAAEGTLGEFVQRHLASVSETLGMQRQMPLALRKRKPSGSAGCQRLQDLRLSSLLDSPGSTGKYGILRQMSTSSNGIPPYACGRRVTCRLLSTSPSQTAHLRGTEWSYLSIQTDTLR